ncbi:hypothetical protein HDV05_006585 [Chytridiales sp. JEL 0842]|nr:hypothetical protein HDV05_006585 [Chytridiales sp. JEL 0842]
MPYSDRIELLRVIYPSAEMLRKDFPSELHLATFERATREPSLILPEYYVKDFVRTSSQTTSIPPSSSWPFQARSSQRNERPQRAMVPGPNLTGFFNSICSKPFDTVLHENILFLLNLSLFCNQKPQQIDSGSSFLEWRLAFTEPFDRYTHYVIDYGSTPQYLQHCQEKVDAGLYCTVDQFDQLMIRIRYIYITLSGALDIYRTQCLGKTESLVKFMNMVGGCGHCEAFDKPLKVCQRCKVAYYCSVECQKAKWKEHKVDCKPQFM